MELLFVNTDFGVHAYNPFNRQECLKYSVPSNGSCIIDDEIIIIHANKPLIYAFKLQRSIQTPKKFVLPGKPMAICSPGIGKFVFVGISGSLYIWHVTSGRCIHSIQCHFQDINRIASNEHFTVTSSPDGQVNIFETVSLLDVNAQPKALIKLNAHSLPITDVFLEEDLLYTSSSDFTVKIWSLEELKENRSEKEKKIKQSSLLLSTLDFPAAVTSIALEGSMKTLFASTSDGRLHKMDMSLKLLEKGPHKTDQTDWRHDASHGDIFIETSLDGLDCLTSSGNTLRIWTSDSAALLRSIQLAGCCHSFYSKVDIWGILKTDLGKVKSKSASMEKVQHVPSKDDVLLRFESLKKTNCPLMELVSLRATQPKAESIERTEENDSEIKRLKKLNSELYRQLAVKVLE
ncbi:Oidioi.mRNA.OKI2018_I69.chr1.g2097.t1.cds [Oikopleura dioica]|uniref:Oidioi.mRNA.OKI2018_I69.chr1.g2097.t1.cds n=1 Tax=Oikopleura dioica TaxID=34765 RepID=A0ABN7SQ00_OIKDI|nr:Oidioi.mRNA.OKI2018_I69.chr1.g2097.t1.cds [Oikopleura dioica]